MLILKKPLWLKKVHRFIVHQGNEGDAELPFGQRAHRGGVLIARFIPKYVSYSCRQSRPGTCHARLGEDDGRRITKEENRRVWRRRLLWLAYGAASLRPRARSHYRG